MLQHYFLNIAFSKAAAGIVINAARHLDAMQRSFDLKESIKAHHQRIERSYRFETVANLYPISLCHNYEHLSQSHLVATLKLRNMINEFERDITWQFQPSEQAIDTLRNKASSLADDCLTFETFTNSQENNAPYTLPYMLGATALTNEVCGFLLSFKQDLNTKEYTAVLDECRIAIQNIQRQAQQLQEDIELYATQQHNATQNTIVLVKKAALKQHNALLQASQELAELEGVMHKNGAHLFLTTASFFLIPFYVSMETPIETAAISMISLITNIGIEHFGFEVYQVVAETDKQLHEQAWWIQAIYLTIEISPYALGIYSCCHRSDYSKLLVLGGCAIVAAFDESMFANAEKGMIASVKDTLNHLPVVRGYIGNLINSTQSVSVETDSIERF